MGELFRKGSTFMRVEGMRKIRLGGKYVHPKVKGGYQIFMNWGKT
jgi:hypothetical protein